MAIDSRPAFDPRTMTDPLAIVTLLIVAVALAERLSRRGVGRAIGGATIAIALGALFSNVGLLPAAADDPGVYRALVATGAPVAIFLLLINVHLAALKRAGTPMLVAFAAGALATLVGVATSAWVTGTSAWLGEFGPPLVGMYVATYIGGGANFNALALHYRVVDQPLLFAGANAVDNVFTTVWIMTLLVLPPLLRRWVPGRTTLTETTPDRSPTTPASGDASRPDMLSLSALLALAFATHTGSVWIATWLQASSGWSIPSILILTTVALVAAQIPAVQRLRGAHVLGVYGSYLFLCVIGAYCDLGALSGLGALALRLAAFVGLAIALHGLLLFGAGLVLRADPDILAIASTANIAGSTTVLPLAQSLGRMELLLPGILVGSLGNGVGTYIGFAVVAWLT